MSFSPYEKYIESGVPWLGRTPADWEVLPTKRFAFRIKDLNLGMKCEERLALTMSGVIPRSLDDLEGLQASEFESYQIFHKDDLAFKLIDLQNIKTSRVGIVPFTGIMSPAYIRLVFDRGLVFPKFAYWFFTDLYNRHIFNQLGGGVRQTLGPEELLLLPFARPTDIRDQIQIARFLDHETARIDALIEEQQRLIELLKEKRQAVISHAVTKGLDPTVPMKDSGVEWLGEVPAHWEVGALKHFISPMPGAIKTGPFGSHLKSEDMKEGPYKVFNQRSVIDADFSAGDNFISEEKFAELKGFTAFPGDVLVTTRGTIGRAAILPDNAEVGILHPCLLRVQVDESKITSSYLCRLIQESHLLKTQLSLMSNSTTIEVIYSETMASLLIPVPPITEQGEIAAFLDDVICKFGALASDANESVRLLQERRSALISAAVTGKIDVRGWQPPAYTQAPKPAVAEAH